MHQMWQADVVFPPYEWDTRWFKRSIVKQLFKIIQKKSDRFFWDKNSCLRTLRFLYADRRFCSKTCSSFHWLSSVLNWLPIRSTFNNGQSLRRKFLAKRFYHWEQSFIGKWYGYLADCCCQKPNRSASVSWEQCYVLKQLGVKKVYCQKVLNFEANVTSGSNELKCNSWIWMSAVLLLGFSPTRTSEKVRWTVVEVTYRLPFDILLSFVATTGNWHLQHVAAQKWLRLQRKYLYVFQDLADYHLGPIDFFRPRFRSLPQSAHCFAHCWTRPRIPKWDCLQYETNDFMIPVAFFKNFRISWASLF